VQDKRSGIDEVPFNIKTSPLFCRVYLAAVLSMRRSRKAGVGVKTKKVNFFSHGFLLLLAVLSFLITFLCLCRLRWCQKALRNQS
jgi:hypothetical protein